MTSRLKTLGEAGQAVWLDFIDRRFLSDGGLRKVDRATELHILGYYEHRRGANRATG